MKPHCDRVDTRWTVIYGSLMIGLELMISKLGSPRPLWIGHGLFIGLVGLGGIMRPFTSVSAQCGIYLHVDPTSHRCT